MSHKLSAVFFDFDSTVVTEESFDLVIARALDAAPDKVALMREVEAITNEGMNGQLAFTESLQKRFAVVPLTVDHFEAVGEALLANITPGMPEVFATLAEVGITTFIISGGFRPSIMPVATRLGVPPERVYTNEVIVDPVGNVTGIDTAAVCYTDDGKAPVVTVAKVAHELIGTVCMVGDGANDLKAYEQGVADYFCGFTANVARDVILQKAPMTAESCEELLEVIKTLQ